MVYRNWQRICEIGNKSSKALMYALATIDLNTPEGVQLMHAFGGCFGTTETQGPIPLSVIIAADRKLGYESAGSRGVVANYHVNGEQVAEEGIAQGYQEFNIPVLDFSSDLPRFRYLATEEGIVLPTAIVAKCHFGEIVEFDGSMFFVLYHCRTKDSETVTLTPAGCIAANL